MSQYGIYSIKSVNGFFVGLFQRSTPALVTSSPVVLARCASLWPGSATDNQTAPTKLMNKAATPSSVLRTNSNVGTKNASLVDGAAIRTMTAGIIPTRKMIVQTRPVALMSSAAPIPRVVFHIAGCVMVITTAQTRVMRWVPLPTAVPQNQSPPAPAGSSCVRTMTASTKHGAATEIRIVWMAATRTTATAPPVRVTNSHATTAAASWTINDAMASRTVGITRMN